jgi:membrane dipeptidase
MALVSGSLVALAAAALPSVLMAPASDDIATTRATQLHHRAIVVDGHADTPQRMINGQWDIGARHPDGGIDIPRMREGGLDALFFSIWTPGTVTGATAIKRAFDQIEAVRRAIRDHPDDLVLATTAAEIRDAAAHHKIAALMGVEGGHLINNDLGTLRTYASLGVRYLTLTHGYNTDWADAATDKPKHNGLTAFGSDVVRELNRLGVMVDVSHVSDKTFADVLAISTVPVIASHSSCRALSASPRNMTDEMMRSLARNGGIVMINYHAPFLSEPFRTASLPAPYLDQLRSAERACGADEGCRTLANARVRHDAMRRGALPAVTWEQIVEHIDHAVRVAGIDHVGLGSDFDGATMPLGMEDASKLPRLTGALLDRGYSDADVTKILGENILRVMEQVQATRLR